MKRQKLAIKGGEKAVTIDYQEGWKQISDQEIQAVNDLLSKGITSIGDGTGIIGEFENNFKKYVGAKYALAQCSGTSTLHSAYFAVGVGSGDEVIVPSYTWHATITPILHCCATPVFCEIDPHTLCADPGDIEKRITPRTKAIAVTHVFGNVAKMDEIMEIAKKHNLFVLEDCSHAHGASYDGKPVGTIGDIGCFSLQGSKALIAGEGGVVVTDDTELYEKILILGHYGRISKDLITGKYRCLGNMGLGIKYRAHPLAVAIANVQLSRNPEINQRRRENCQKLNDGLRDLKGIETIKPYPKAKRAGFLEFKFLYHREELQNVSLNKFLEALKAEGLNVWLERAGYGLMHLEPLLNDFDFTGLGGCFYDWKLSPEPKREKRYHPGDLPITETTLKKIFSMPAFTIPPDGLIDQYISGIRKAVENIGELK